MLLVGYASLTFNGAAETKATFHRNPRAFRQYLFRQKIFHDVADPDISVELFGHTLPLPAITAPVGSFSLIGKDTEREVAEGTDRAAAMMFVPSIGGISHHWTENTADADIVTGAEVFVDACRRLLSR